MSDSKAQLRKRIAHLEEQDYRLRRGIADALYEIEAAMANDEEPSIDLITNKLVEAYECWPR